MIRVDLHLHTQYSHGQAGVEAMYRAARLRGLDIIGFSEHSPRPAGYDYPNDYRDRLAAAYADYIGEVRALQAAENGPDGLPVLLGLEMDWFAGEQDFIARTIGQYSYDYVIAGIHFLDTWGFDGTPDDWAGLDEARCFELYERYYETMIAMAGTGLFHIVAHPDLIKIFSVDSFHRWLETSSGQARVLDALKAVNAAGMVMEVSSAGLRKPCKEIYPAPALMRMAAELGLAISFASDAHCVNTPGYAFEELAAYARSFGFSQSAWFQGGQRRMLDF